MRRTLKAIDIERLENTSFASVFLVQGPLEHGMAVVGPSDCCTGPGTHCEPGVVSYTPICSIVATLDCAPCTSSCES